MRTSPFARLGLAAALIMALFTPAAAAPKPKPTPVKPAVSAAMPEMMSLGSPTAKIQLVEYASPTCPHCARFNAEVFPAFKAKYVDTGKVRYSLGEFITPPNDLAGAAWVLARCGGPAHYFGIVEGVWRSQPQWVQGADIGAIFLGVARANGLTEAQFNGCLNDDAAYQAVNARVTKAQAAGVRSTPTFMINGKVIGEGEMSLADLDKAIAAASKAGGR